MQFSLWISDEWHRQCSTHGCDNGITTYLKINDFCLEQTKQRAAVQFEQSFDMSTTLNPNAPWISAANGFEILYLNVSPICRSICKSVQHACGDKRGAKSIHSYSNDCNISMQAIFSHHRNRLTIVYMRKLVLKTVCQLSGQVSRNYYARVISIKF